MQGAVSTQNSPVDEEPLCNDASKLSIRTKEDETVGVFINGVELKESCWRRSGLLVEFVEGCGQDDASASGASLYLNTLCKF